MSCGRLTDRERGLDLGDDRDLPPALGNALGQGRTQRLDVLWRLDEAIADQIGSVRDHVQVGQVLVGQRRHA